jgi:Concanavalin A-like lectin/glucanases superfamily
MARTTAGGFLGGYILGLHPLGMGPLGSFSAPSSVAPSIPDPEWLDVTYMPRANTGNTGTDLSSNGLALTLNNMTTTGTTRIQDKYAWIFNGSNGSIVNTTSAAQTAASFAAAFTVETWIYLTTLAAAAYGIWANGPGNSGTGTFLIYSNSSNEIAVQNNGSDLLTGAVLSINKWYHVALVRSSGTITLYLNGSSQSSTSNAVSFSANGIWIGEASDGSVNFPGNMAGIRVTNGFARYTQNFLPPLTPFANY